MLSDRKRRKDGPKAPTALAARMAAMFRAWIEDFQAKILDAIGDWESNPVAFNAQIKTDAPGRKPSRFVFGKIGQLKVALEEKLDPAQLSPQIEKFAQRVSVFGKDEFRRVIGIPSVDTGLGVALNQFRRENVEKIRSLAGKQLDDITLILQTAEANATRVETLRDQIQAAFGVTQSKAELLARDQVLKLNGQLTGKRQQNAGIVSYIWTTSLDERVRESHQELAGTTQQWSDPPEVDEKTGRTAHPGEDYQCRCTAFPILPELDEPDETDE